MLQGRSGVARRRDNLEAIFSKARQRDGMRAFEKLTAVVDGRRVIVEDPPVVVHVQTPVATRWRRSSRTTGPPCPRTGATSWSATGSWISPSRWSASAAWGPGRFILVLQGRDESDPLILQAKEATASVMEPHLQPSLHDHHGQRVVVGQQLMQGTSDIFLGWTRGPGGRAFYLRQLWDMKGSVDTSILQPPGLTFYGSICGRVLHGPMPGPATPWRSRPTSAPPTRSTGRSPTSRRITRT